MIEDLLKYQEEDAKLKKIENELASSEERKKAASAKKYLEGFDENLSKIDLKANELITFYEKTSGEIVELNEQAKDLSKAIEEAESEQETDYLLKKLDELVATIKYSENESKNLSQRISAVIKEYAVLKNTYKAAKTQYEEYGVKYNELKASKADEMNKIKENLSKLEKKVEPSLMERYLKKRKEEKMFPVIFEVTSDVCGACHMNISLNEIAKLNNGEILECENCRRLLFKKK